MTKFFRSLTTLGTLFAVIWGPIIYCFADLIFRWIVKKNYPKNIITKMCLAESAKLIFFVGLTCFSFRLVKIQPVAFFVSVLTFMVISFIKNLLQLVI